MLNCLPDAADRSIAIIGMAARYPGSEDLAGFWRTIRQGEVAIGQVPPDRWDSRLFHTLTPKLRDTMYTDRLAHLSDIYRFAPDFFRITPKRARLMDPQQRLQLECARIAVEDAGYAHRSLPRESTGVYVGISVSEHKDIITSRIHATQWSNSPADAAALAHVPHIQPYTMVGQMLNMAAANVSHGFDFRGPSLAVDTACSSALVALHEAVLHLRAGVTDAALVGGVYLNLDPINFLTFSSIGALSRSGCARPFDRSADGFVMGEGAGAVVLKRLGDALRDGDRVWAVIRGIAVNNDGRGAGPMTPRPEGQVDVLRRAWRDAGLAPRSAGLLEAHGTGTAAGDAAELSALHEVFSPAGSGDAADCALGAVKANIGHSLAASGLASLIKAALALRHRTRPPHAGFATPHPALDSAASAGFRITRTAEPWPCERHPRRAGVSSFGFGGTNAHAVLEEASGLSPSATTPRPPRGRRWPFVVSAPDRTMLDRYLLRLYETLSASSDPLEDLSWTLCRTRRPDRVQVKFTAATRDELLHKLLRRTPGDTGYTEPGFPENLDDFFAGSSGTSSRRCADLPPSPLLTAEFRAVAHRPDPEPPHRELEDLVLAAIVAVGAYTPEQLSGDQRLLSDLGFDSLMAVDLAARLMDALPELTQRTCARLLRCDPTIAEFTAGVIAEATTAATGPTLRRQPAPALYLEPDTHGWLRDHCLDGICTVPIAMVLGWCVARAEKLGVPAVVTDLQLIQGIRVPDQGVYVWIDATRQETGIAVEIGSSASLDGSRTRHYTARLPFVAPAPPAQFSAGALVPGSLPLTSFYSAYTFHGPGLQVIAETPRLDARAVSGVVRSPHPVEAGFDVPALDGVLQVAAYWAAAQLGRRALPVAVREFCLCQPLTGAGEVYCLGVLDSVDDETQLCAGLDLFDGQGQLLAQIRGLQARDHHPQSTTPLRPADPATFTVALFPEVLALRERMSKVRAAGLAIPYFHAHDAVARGTSRVAGREVISFSTYNYLGLCGSPAVAQAAVDAVHRYGTSVSASRIAAGERPIHRELEAGLARFLDCEDALAFVSGHATNVSVIGHVAGPEDLVVYDSLAHDSILSGARLSGAKARSFPHNDCGALDRLLTELRPGVRRVLIAVEGVYSMDGDLAPLDRLIRLKQKHGALLLVDEAHSLGVLGATGRGIGEHFGTPRSGVDFWMGTLSKALASCGGYIAGSHALIEYLKYSVPGFLYSVGLSPANAAAALAALAQIEAHPGLVGMLRANADLFRRLCRERGINTGRSAESAVVPCLIGDSHQCLAVAQALQQDGFDVHPIVSPAVPESSARLRFFLSAAHSGQQIRYAVECLHRELTVRGVGLRH